MESSQGIGQRSRRARLVHLGLLATTLALFLCPLGVGGSSAAAAPSVRWQTCEVGEGAGHCINPRGIAADPENGHIFVADQTNHRIDEFNALGQFLKAWGWDVVASGPGDDTVAPEDEFEVCVPENGDACQAGETGGEVGQLVRPQGVALDSAGNVYVAEGEFSNRRVQKFDPDGNPVLMFGGEVNKTKVESGSASEEEENLCPFDPDDKCQQASQGTGKGQFGPWLGGDFIAIAPTDKVYVGDSERIQRFDTAGVHQDECEVSGTVQSLDTDAAGNLYAAYNGQLKVRKLRFATPACEEVGSFELPKLGDAQPVPSAVAVDPKGNVYAFGPINPSSPTDPIFKFDSAGNLIESFGNEEFDGSTGLAANLCPESEPPGNLYVTNLSEANAFVRAYGTEPIGCFRARTLPATNVEETSAHLNGTVNPKGEAVTECFFRFGETTGYGQQAECKDPKATEIGTGSVPVAVRADLSGLEAGTVYHFRLLARVGGELETGADESFKTKGPPVISDEHVVSATDDEATLKALVNPEGFATNCHFEYGPTASYGQSSEEVAVGADRSDHATLAVLEGLAPDTTYHWRLVCVNSSDTSASEDHIVDTYPSFTPETDCPNQAFRVGPSAPLPDCRAYEMVSPVDKNGGDIAASLTGSTDPGGYVQVSRDGEKITYTSTTTFGDQLSGRLLNQYLAAREEGDGDEELEPGEGWSSHGIQPPLSGKWTGTNVFRDLIAFSADLCSAWLLDRQVPPPTADAQPGYANLYRRDNCEPGAGGLEALTTAPPPGGTLFDYVTRNSVQGHSEDSRHALFVANAKLTADAAAGGGAQIYDRFGGKLHLVSVLPDGSPALGSSAVGSGWEANLDGAVSADGSRVYWTNGSNIYLRENPEQPQSALDGENNCLEADKACTVAVDFGLFWAASPDGAKALYEKNGDLYLFDLASEASDPVAEDVEGVAETSEDLARIYFVSEKALPEAGQNSEEAEAVEGEPNLYLAAGEELSFVATLAEGDLSELSLSPYSVTALRTYKRATRVSADGGTLAFNSRAPLTGVDNTEATSGEPAVQVYAYQSEADKLLCVSCNPSGARPRGRELPEPYVRHLEGHVTEVFAAAWIPTWEHPTHASNVLSADGGHLFFNANDGLLPRDGNGAPDVYEWEAPGVGRCTKESPSYFPRNGGCLDLISSGQSPYESEFWEASPDGRDVFFTTESSLLPQDPGLIDLYDARVNGGFPQPEFKSPCEGEACANPPPAPEFGAPASEAFRGPGNVSPRKARPCRKGKRKVRRNGKVRCVKKHRKHRRRAGHNRRPGR